MFSILALSRFVLTYLKGKKQYRAIAGLSMGGVGTYMYALHRPELFSSACPLSAGFGGARSLSDTKAQMKRWGKIFTEKEIESYYQNYNTLYLIENMPEEQKKAVRWYIDNGDDDFVASASEGSCVVHIAMLKNQITHEFRMRDGAHNWTYWRTALPEVLNFISQSFHR